MAKEYNIVKATGRCITCQKEMAPGEEFVATVREVQGTADDEEEFAREDYCPGYVTYLRLIERAKRAKVL